VDPEDLPALQTRLESAPDLGDEPADDGEHTVPEHGTSATRRLRAGVST
jgi:hypothetical protein